MSNAWQMVPLGHVVRDLTNERLIQVEPDDDVVDPTISSQGHTISVATIQKGASVRIVSRVRLVPGDLVFSRLHTQNGAFAFAERQYLATTTFLPLAVDETQIHKRFLFWALHVRVPTLSSSDTVGRETYRPQDILSLQIPLPRLSDQLRIVRRIEQLASKVEEARLLRQDAIREVENLKKSALRQVFSSGADYKEVSLDSVCADIIDNLHSNPVYADEGVPCVRSPDVGWGKLFLERALKTSEEEYIRRTIRGKPMTDDIVLVREGGGTGKAGIVENCQRFSLGQRVMMLRPNKGLTLPKFLLYQILSPAIYDDQIIPLCKGSASPHLNIGALRKFTVYLPSLPEQHRIVAYLDDLQTKIDSLKQMQADTAAELDAMLPSILDRAFKGDL